jgi:hypothetical protein
MELFFPRLLVLIMASRWARAIRSPSRCPAPRSSPSGSLRVRDWIFAGNTDAYFHSGGPIEWLSAGVTNLRGVYWEVERDTLIAIPLFIFMGIMLQRSKIAEDLLVTMAQLFGPVPGGLGISVVFVGALLAATTGIVGATVVAMGLISLPAMLRNNYSHAARHRHHRGLGHARADHPAVDRADHPRRPAGQRRGPGRRRSGRTCYKEAPASCRCRRVRRHLARAPARCSLAPSSRARPRRRSTCSTS